MLISTKHNVLRTQYCSGCNGGTTSTFTMVRIAALNCSKQKCDSTERDFVRDLQVVTLMTVTYIFLVGTQRATYEPNFTIDLNYYFFLVEKTSITNAQSQRTNRPARPCTHHSASLTHQTLLVATIPAGKHERISLHLNRRSQLSPHSVLHNNIQQIQP